MTDTVIAAWVQASPQWAIFFTVLVGGAWALVSARRVRRMEAARWLHQMNQDFYKHKKFDRIRIDFDRDFSGTVGRLLHVQIIEGIENLSDSDAHYALEIDNYLNYFENLLYMVECKHLTSRDLEAMYAYWLSLFSLDKNAIVRVYAASYGYERVAKWVGGKEVTAVSCPNELVEKLQAQHETTIVSSRDRCMLRFSDQSAAIVAIKSLGPSIRVICQRIPDDELDAWCIDPIPPM